MIERVISKHLLGQFSEIRQNLTFWQKKNTLERVHAVDFLRKMYYGDFERLQRVVRVIQRPSC